MHELFKKVEIIAWRTQDKTGREDRGSVPNENEKMLSKKMAPPVSALFRDILAFCMFNEPVALVSA